MIKKKNNVLVITVVTILAMIVLGLNFSQYFRYSGAFQPIERPNEAAIKKMQERQAKSIQPTGSSMPTLSGMIAIDTDAAKTGVQIDKVPDLPSILIPSKRMYKADRSSATTTPQWYRDNSLKKEESQEGSTYSEGN